jgi:hypothetical protein
MADGAQLEIKCVDGDGKKGEDAVEGEKRELV